MAGNPYNRYKQMEVTTTDPIKLVVLLYEGAIVRLKRAIDNINKKDFEAKGKDLIRAHDIVFELLSSLDRERGGEVAKNLESMYVYILRRIMEANTSMDIGIIEEVIAHLEKINEAWKELAKQRGVDVMSNSTAGTSMSFAKMEKFL